VVALEVGENSQAAIDRFLTSDGGGRARARFLADPHWNQAFKDGRSSVAYFALFERLRGCLRTHEIAAVEAIRPERSPSIRPGLPQAPSLGRSLDLNAAMAALLERAAGLRRDALVVALVGNAHARKRSESFNGRTIVPAAADLPPRETVAVTVNTAGEAWNCEGPTPADCGVHSLLGDPPERRSVVLEIGGRDYDGLIDLGEPATASPPAVTSDGRNAPRSSRAARPRSSVAGASHRSE
jgi:hypothetical protein